MRARSHVSPRAAALPLVPRMVVPDSSVQRWPAYLRNCTDPFRVAHSVHFSGTAKRKEVSQE